MKHCVQVDTSDNVATLLDDAKNEFLEILGAGQNSLGHREYFLIYRHEDTPALNASCHA